MKPLKVNIKMGGKGKGKDKSDEGGGAAGPSGSGRTGSEKKSNRTSINGALRAAVSEVIYPYGQGSSAGTTVIHYGPFFDMVKSKFVPDYYSIVHKKDHMYCKRILAKTNQPGYPDLPSFVNDVDKIVSNCKAYNSINPATGRPYGVSADPSLIGLAEELRTKILEAAERNVAKLKD